MRREDNKLRVFNKNREFFEEFLGRTDQKKNTNMFLIKNYPKNLKDIEILSVGAGSGEDLLDFLKYLKSKKTNFRFFYNDPSKLSFDVFKKNARELGLLEYINKSFLCKFEDIITADKFDIIIASHAFYYIKEWDKSMRKLRDYLKENGVAFIFAKLENSDNYKIRNKFSEVVLGKKYVERSAAAFIKTLQKFNLKYKIREIVSHLDMSGTASKYGEVSASGKKLLSFLLMRDYEDLDDNIKFNIDAYLNKRIRNVNKKLYFALYDYCIIIYK